jgi:Na+/H+ antiporter NhaC
MLWTGYQGVQGEEGVSVTLLTMFEYTDVAKSLVLGGLFGLAVTLALYFSKGISASYLPKGFLEGIKSMLPAIYILSLAWMIVDLIGQLKTGEYLAGLVEQSNMNTALLPVILFILAGFMAFATGSCRCCAWGSLLSYL